MCGLSKQVCEILHLIRSFIYLSVAARAWPLHPILIQCEFTAIRDYNGYKAFFPLLVWIVTLQRLGFIFHHRETETKDCFEIISSFIFYLFFCLWI